MRFLGGLFRILLVVIAVAFAYNNWTVVPVKLWSGLVADVNLPLLLAIAFLLGLLPMLAIYHAARWRWKQRMANTERALADIRTAAARVEASPTPVVVADPGATADAPLPPVVQS